LFSFFLTGLLVFFVIIYFLCLGFEALRDVIADKLKPSANVHPILPSQPTDVELCAVKPTDDREPLTETAPFPVVADAAAAVFVESAPSVRTAPVVADAVGPAEAKPDKAVAVTSIAVEESVSVPGAVDAASSQGPSGGVAVSATAPDTVGV
jgi:hypothetical protein